MGPERRAAAVTADAACWGTGKLAPVPVLPVRWWTGKPLALPAKGVAIVAASALLLMCFAWGYADPRPILLPLTLPCLLRLLNLLVAHRQPCCLYCCRCCCKGFITPIRGAAAVAGAAAAAAAGLIAAAAAEQSLLGAEHTYVRHRGSAGGKERHAVC